MLLGHVTPVESSTFVLMFLMGLAIGLAGGCGLGWLLARRRQ